ATPPLNFDANSPSNVHLEGIVPEKQAWRHRRKSTGPPGEVGLGNNSVSDGLVQVGESKCSEGSELVGVSNNGAVGVCPKGDAAGAVKASLETGLREEHLIDTGRQAHVSGSAGQRHISSGWRDGVDVGTIGHEVDVARTQTRGCIDHANL